MQDAVFKHSIHRRLAAAVMILGAVVGTAQEQVSRPALGDGPFLFDTAEQDPGLGAQQGLVPPVEPGISSGWKHARNRTARPAAGDPRREAGSPPDRRCARGAGDPTGGSDGCGARSQVYRQPPGVSHLQQAGGKQEGGNGAGAWTPGRK